MKRKSLLIILVFFFAFGGIVNTATAQNSKKEQKAAKNAAEEAALEKAVDDAVAAGSFRYIATEIVNGGNAMVTNVRLNSLYTVVVSPSQLKCYLPIYGTPGPTSHPTLLRSLDFVTSKYSINKEPMKKGGYIVTMKTKDANNYNSEYTFELSIYPGGRNTRLRVSTPFDGAVTFSGNIYP